MSLINVDQDHLFDAGPTFIVKAEQPSGSQSQPHLPNVTMLENDESVQIQTIEVDSQVAENILRFISSSDGRAISVLPGNVNFQLENFENGMIHQLQGHSGAISTGETESGEGGAYVFNPETGDIQLIDVSQAFTTIEGNEVEVITVDSDRFGTDIATVLGQVVQTPPPPPLESKFSVSFSSSGGTAVAVTPSSSSKKMPMKSAPALLRNSRRATIPDNSKGDANATSSRSIIEPYKSKACSSPQSSVVKGGGQGNSRKTKSSGTQSRSKNFIDHSKPVKYLPKDEIPQQSSYVIYQNSEGQQVVELFDSTQAAAEYTDSTTGNIIYQFGDGSQPLFLEGGNLESLGLTISEKIPKGKSKSAKKRTPVKKAPSVRKTSQKDNKEADKPRKGVSELKCMEDGCLIVSNNISELRKHLTEKHDLQFDSETTIFATEAEFKEWREQYERERMVSFIFRGGTKKISKVQSVTYMVCHRSGHYKPTMVDTKNRKRKMKPQGSCKIGGYCTAGIKLLKNLETGEIKMDICHTHYGHPLDSEAIPHLRVNPALRKIILKKFEEGLTFADMLAYIHLNPDGLEGLRLVDRRAVRNIYDTWKKPSKSHTKQLSSEKSAESPEGASKEDTITISEIFPLKLEKRLDLDLSECLEDVDDDIESESDKNKDQAADSRRNGFTIKQDDSNTADELLAPILFSANEIQEEYGVDCHMDDDSNPPLLIAIQSIKSLRSNGDNVESSQEKNEKMNNETELVADKTASGAKRKVEDANPKDSGIKKRKTEKVDQSKSPKSPNKRSDTTNSTKDKISALEGNSEDLNADLTTSENEDDDFGLSHIKISAELEATIDKLHKHDEPGATILLYKKFGELNVKYGGWCRQLREDDFCLIVQTPKQRQILQMFPSVVGLEILDSPKRNGNDLKLAFLSVLDEYREPIPVAWMVADSMCARVFNQFFKMMRYHCGELNVKYIMAPRNEEVYKAWTSQFSNKPKMLQSDFIARRDLRVLLNRNFPNDSVRLKAWNTVEKMMREHYIGNLKSLKMELSEIVSGSESGANYLKKMEKDWYPRIEEWSFAYRVGASANLLFVADSFVKLRKFVSFKGTKRLKQSIEQILKVGYDKCFLRAKRMFKGDQKLMLLLGRVENYHKLAKTELREALITEYPDKHQWELEFEGGGSTEAVVFHVQSRCGCKLICRSCNVCIHEYICSCDIFTKHRLTCAHIHKIHCFRNNIIDEDDDGQEMESSHSPLDKKHEANNEDAIINFVYKSDEEHGTEITLPHSGESQMQCINISDVIQAAALFRSSNNGESSDARKIVSITDADMSMPGSIILQLDTD